MMSRDGNVSEGKRDTKRELQGRIALVTGAGQRLGREIALALAARGADLILHYRDSRREAEELAQRLRGSGRRAWAVGADFTEPAAAEALLEEARGMTGEGRVDLLVNSASLYEADRLSDLRPEDLERQLRVNAVSPFLLSRAAARQGAGGAIVNLLDCRIGEHDPAHVSYSLSKRVLFDLTRRLALELAPAWRVNAVAPGLILPPRGKTREELDHLQGSNPLQRWGDPVDVTRAVLFLLESEFITGQVLFVDGGRFLKGCLYGI